MSGRMKGATRRGLSEDKKKTLFNLRHWKSVLINIRLNIKRHFLFFFFSFLLKFSEFWHNFIYFFSLFYS